MVRRNDLQAKSLAEIRHTGLRALLVSFRLYYWHRTEGCHKQHIMPETSHGETAH